MIQMEINMTRYMMFLIDVAEWCVELLVLALAFFFFALGTLVFMTICSVAKKYIDEKIKAYYSDQ